MIDVISLEDANFDARLDALLRGEHNAYWIGETWPRDARVEAVAGLAWPRRVLPSPSWRRARARGMSDDDARRRYTEELDGSAALERIAMRAKQGRVVFVMSPEPDDALVASVLAEATEKLVEVPSGNESLARAFGIEHEEMLDAIHGVRVLLVEGDLTGARATFEALRANLQSHAAFEERRIFAGTGVDLDDAMLVIARAEHDKIDSAGRELQGELAAAVGGAGSAANRLRLIDLAGRLEHVLEHHFAREELQVFPRLDSALPEASRRKLLEDRRREG
ncbi:MAG: hemerythrin domain-containing protein [Planctomycetes bacterium]|nr:hemerythrin domain-containing protein [Planctomycetota bacterium]